MTRVTITFDVTDEQYNDYEDIVDTFTTDLDQIGINVVDVYENDESVTVSRDIQVEIDAELFFNNISMDRKSWSFDYDDLAENTKVFEYIKEEYPNELEALKEGRADYLTVWYD